MKAFQKTPRKVLTVTIDEQGDLLYLKSDSADVLLECGEVVQKRASHVLPAKFWSRLAFRFVRFFVRDDSMTAAWCRTWRGPWLVDTSPTAGVVLPGRWMNRQDAIDAEIAFLNNWFLHG